MRRLSLLLILTLLIAGCSHFFPKKIKRTPASILDKNRQHAHMMHLDGFRPDVFKRLLENGQLPHFKFLLDRGRVSYNGSTVDKSETMKVILSYLSSRYDTEVVGWWQWDRSTYSFRNFWMDPVEIINYALGMEFPKRATLFDFFRAHDHSVASGFGLHRRGVEYNDYGRAYFEGLMGVIDHKYLDQAHATMVSLKDIYERKAKKGEQTPIFTHSLLAPADEMAHLVGVTSNKIAVPEGKKEIYKCWNRKKRKKDRNKDERDFVFKLLEGKVDDVSPGTVFVDKLYWDKKVYKKKGYGHFQGVTKKKRKKKFCVRVPVMDFHATPSKNSKSDLGKKTKHVVNPDYVLGMILVDIQLGQLINTYLSIDADCKKGQNCFFPENGKGIEAYLKQERKKNSLFERTLFVLAGDHGMADSKWMTAKCVFKAICDKHGRQKGSVNKSFIEVLNEKLGLADTKEVKSQGVLGIDDTFVPKELLYPHLAKYDDLGVKVKIDEANKWANDFFDTIKKQMKKKLGRKFWYLLFLKHAIVYPKLDKTIEPRREDIVRLLAKLYLRAEPKYMEAERKKLPELYDKHVRLVYGGGARNNAELSIPAKNNDGTYTWSKRPTYEEIIGYSPKGDGKTLLDSLKSLKSVGLVFIRKNNPLSYGDAYGVMEISVRDRFGNEGTIKVWRDKETLEQVFGYFYQGTDPLGIKNKEPGKWHYGTFGQWNNWSINNNEYYLNPVAGMGSYLHSENPSIGDMVVTHSQGWNFGANSGGHGGLHAGEKKTVIMVSGPELKSKEPLMSRLGYAAELDEQGNVVVKRSYEKVHPTVVDIAPSILDWLGYENQALTEFSRSSAFENYLENWVDKQQIDIVPRIQTTGDLQQALGWAGFQGLDLKPVMPYFKRLFKFMPTEAPEILDADMDKEVGNTFILE